MIHIDEVSVMTPAQDVFIAYLTRFQCDDVMLVHDFATHQYNHFMWTRIRITNERERANRRGCECVHELDIRNLCIRFSSQLFSTIIYYRRCRLTLSVNLWLKCNAVRRLRFETNRECDLWKWKWRRKKHLCLFGRQQNSR